MGAVNAFFSAFADKTMAFEYNHIVSLYQFNTQINKLCDFNNNFNKFIQLVDNCDPGGSTKLYDCMDVAIQDLLELKKKYPNIILRMIALTDGEDNQSVNTPETIVQKIVANRIILDSFVVSQKCLGLKQITMASGGRCYQPFDINFGL